MMLNGQNFTPVDPVTIRTRCAQRFATFSLLVQETGWFDPTHERLCDWIQYHIQEGQRLDRDVLLCITMPRGSLKSTIVTRNLAIWLSTLDPNLRMLIATNTHTNARKKLQSIRGIFDSHDLFRRLYPNLLPTRSCKWTDEAADVNRPMPFPEATFEACGMGTVKIGCHYNIIFEDDTTAPDVSAMKIETTTPSIEAVERAIGWHKQAHNLLVPKGRRIRIVVSTRWCDFDLVQHVRENEDYKFFDMPAMTDDGKPNFPTLYNVEKLREIEKTLGPYMYSCLFLNRPLDPNLRKFQREWFHYCTPAEVPEGFHSIAVDPAISEKDSACETAITHCVHHTNESKQQFLYFREDIHKHLHPHEIATHTINMACKCLGKVVLIIETVAFQAALKYIFRDEMIKRGVNFDIVEMNSRTAKEARIEGLLPYFANGRIIFVRGGITPETESQFLQFPNGRLVDVIDSWSMHLKVHKGDRVNRTPLPKAPEAMGWDSVLDELQARYKRNQQGLRTGLDARNVEYSSLSTGLGLHIDANTFRRG